MSYTPGPWHVETRTRHIIPGQPDTYDVFVVLHHGETRAKMIGEVGNVLFPESEANARLIAAAPDMLEALKLAEATMMRLANTDARLVSIQGTISVCTNALNKAEGRK